MEKNFYPVGSGSWFNELVSSAIYKSVNFFLVEFIDNIFPIVD